jgi:hypothetical protein
MSDALMDLHAHYKAVRARLNGGQPSKQVEIIELPVVEPDPPAAPPLEMLRTYGPDLLRGLHASKEVREKILPILEKHRINWIDVVGKSQKWKYTKCRFEVFAKLNAHGWSLSRIGSLCGDRDHTTVLSGINRFLKENLTEAEIAVAKDCGVRVVDYYENKMMLIECRRMG